MKTTLCTRCKQHRPRSAYHHPRSTLCRICKAQEDGSYPGETLTIGRLLFIEHAESVAARWQAEQDGKRIPPRRWAYYGGETLTEPKLRQRLKNTPTLRGML